MCAKVVKTALFIVKKFSHEHEYELRFDWPQYYLSCIELSQKCANVEINVS